MNDQISKLLAKSLILVLIPWSSTFAMTKKKEKDELEGYQVKFDYEGHPAEREIAYQYYLDEESKYMPGIEKKDLGIDLYDIDDDGKKEILVYVDGGDRCPRAGCPFAILKKDIDNSSNYLKIPFIGHFSMYKSSMPKIINSPYSNYHDIIFGENRKIVSLWRWNGKYYDGKYMESLTNLKKIIKNGE